MRADAGPCDPFISCGGSSPQTSQKRGNGQRLRRQKTFILPLKSTDGGRETHSP